MANLDMNAIIASLLAQTSTNGAAALKATVPETVQQATACRTAAPFVAGSLQSIPKKGRDVWCLATAVVEKNGTVVPHQILAGKVSMWDSQDRVVVNCSDGASYMSWCADLFPQTDEGKANAEAEVKHRMVAVMHNVRTKQYQRQRLTALLLDPATTVDGLSSEPVKYQATMASVIGANPFELFPKGTGSADRATLLHKAARAWCKENKKEGLHAMKAAQAFVESYRKDFPKGPPRKDDVSAFLRRETEKIAHTPKPAPVEKVAKAPKAEVTVAAKAPKAETVVALPKVGEYIRLGGKPCKIISFGNGGASATVEKDGKQVIVPAVVKADGQMKSGKAIWAIQAVPVSPEQVEAAKAKGKAVKPAPAPVAAEPKAKAKGK